MVRNYLKAETLLDSERLELKLLFMHRSTHIPYHKTGVIRCKTWMFKNRVISGYLLTLSTNRNKQKKALPLPRTVTNLPFRSQTSTPISVRQEWLPHSDKGHHSFWTTYTISTAFLHAGQGGTEAVPEFKMNLKDTCQYCIILKCISVFSD